MFILLKKIYLSLFMSISQLENCLGYTFYNTELLIQALTHRSYSILHNERLEFLGDSVLNCAIATIVFRKFNELDEGNLSRIRSNLVNQKSLYKIAQTLNISENLRLGTGELRSGGIQRPSILADALEAIFGSIFLDSGFEVAQKVIKNLYTPILDYVINPLALKDSKTLLQEYLQRNKIDLPLYSVIAKYGAAHDQKFEVECLISKLSLRVLSFGINRRSAEQAAAKKALEKITNLTPSLLGT